MKILFLTTTHNSLSRLAYLELTKIGHDVRVHLALGETEMIQAVHEHSPDLVVAPMLKKAIPDVIWRNFTCLIVHPGIKGDRGPSSLDWAILHSKNDWGVTILQTNKEMDAGDIWASVTFRMRKGSKSTIYRHEVTTAAMKGLLLAIERFEIGNFLPEPLDYSKSDVKGCLQASMKQGDRHIDLTMTTEDIITRIHSADSYPGVLDEILGEMYYLFGAHYEDVLKGKPGEILAYRNGAICRATGDGAVWITHLKKKNTENTKFFKVPAVLALSNKIKDVPESHLKFDEAYEGRTFREIWYEEKNHVGYLHFDFYNGAMSTE